MPFSALLPKEYSFFDFFEQHASKCVEGARLLLQLLKNVQSAEALAKEIKEVEHAGDKITHHTIETLHKTFITPIDREEIHQLISGMDDILDFMDAASQRVVLYEITEVTAEAQEIGEVLLRATEEVQEAVRGGMARLFKESTDPIYIIKWKEIYEFLEEATDACEDVANIIEGVVLEH